MSLERVFELHFHLIARKRTIPAVLASDANADGEIVNVGNRSGKLFAVWQCDRCENGLFIRIKHVSLELNGIVFVGDASEVSGWRMAFAAAAGSLEIEFP